MGLRFLWVSGSDPKEASRAGDGKAGGDDPDLAVSTESFSSTSGALFEVALYLSLIHI